MPNGKTHDIISFITIPIIGVITWLITMNLTYTFFILSTYVFSSFMFNGDLDIISRPYNRWWVFKIIWVPYQMIFKHRSIFTHGIIIGTIVRLIYLGLLPFLYFYFIKDINFLLLIKPDILICTLFGLELGSTIHTISDKLF